MRRLAVVLPVFALVGCYSLQPIREGVSPEVGTAVALHVNDAGRVALSGPMGSGIEVVEGRLLEGEGGTFVISVSQVRVLGGSVQFWSNEIVRVEKGHVRSIAERRFSRGRTVVASATWVGGLAFIASRGLLGFGFGGDDPIPTDTGVVSLRIIWP